MRGLPPRTCPGDIWLLRFRRFCGDDPGQGKIPPWHNTSFDVVTKPC